MVIKAKETVDNKTKEIKCEEFKLLIRSEEIIRATIKMKKGFTNSTGWKRNIYISSHLFAPFTSTPKIGTKINNIRLNKKIGAKALLMISVSIMDNKIIKEKETKA